MTVFPQMSEDPHDDLCWECGREVAECACGTSLPDEFDPMDENGPDPDWDGYENDLTKETDDE